MIVAGKRKPDWLDVRDKLSYAGGFLGMAYEAIGRRGHPDYGLIPWFFAMLGLPQFLKTRGESKDDDDDDPRRGDDDGDTGG